MQKILKRMKELSSFDLADLQEGVLDEIRRRQGLAVVREGADESPAPAGLHIAETSRGETTPSLPRRRAA